MGYCKGIITTLVLIALFCLSFPHKVYAYLDPGTGSFMLQFLIAALVGGFFAIKQLRDKAKIFLKNLFSKNRRS